MLHAVEVKPDVYWVGGVDWNERNFHGYTTDRGSTYNAYLIMDEHPTLIDTCKPEFADELIERVREVVDPARIEYIVANHVEQDHSGGLPAVCALAPNARIVASVPYGVSGTLPMTATSSIMLYMSMALCATAKPVAPGGCAWMTLHTSGRFS